MAITTRPRFDLELLEVGSRGEEAGEVRIGWRWRRSGRGFWRLRLMPGASARWAWPYGSDREGGEGAVDPLLQGEDRNVEVVIRFDKQAPGRGALGGGGARLQ